MFAFDQEQTARVAFGNDCCSAEAAAGDVVAMSPQ
jgi:hypothetical protein